MDKEQVEQDFEFLKKDKDVLAVLLFGSWVKDKGHERSDIDICILAPEGEPREVISKVFRNLDVEKKNYDVHAFEELTLRLKHQVIKDHDIIWCRDNKKLQEHFYKYRKIWQDQSKARGVA